MKCERPIWIKETSDMQGTEVPCGRCYSCIQTKRSVWTFRLLMELRVSESAYFITLTYNPKHVPYVSGYKGIQETLNKEHLTQFIKNTRQYIHRTENKDPRWLKKGIMSRKWSPKLRYYATAEYGGKGLRPHFHIILYNLPNDYIEYDYIKDENFSEVLDSIWKKGQIYIGKVEQGSAHYMTKYHLLPITEKWDDSDQRVKPYAVMSRKPGIGKNWIDGQIINYYNNSKNSYATLKNGSKVPIGRYLKQKIQEEISEESVRTMHREAKQKFNEEDKWKGQSIQSAKDILASERAHTSANNKKAYRQLKRNNKL